jgi:hypothetical protein
MEANSALGGEWSACRLLIYMNEIDHMLVVTIIRDTKAT